LKRLIDEELQPGSPECALAELVRRTPRFERASFEKERILAEVRVAVTSPRRRAWAIAPAVVVLTVAAMAAAAVGRTWFSRPSSPLPSAAPSAASTPAPFATALPEPPSNGPAFELPVAPPAVEDHPAPPPLPKSSREAPSARLGRSVDDHHPESEDPGPVLEAIRALRSRGDAVRASALLSEYLRAHPRSVLSEDALALSIEAALARRDSRSAGDLGRRYLEQFPSGRYEAFASQTVRTNQP
jgi:hypothetical protein